MVSLTFENPAYLWFLLAVPLLIVAHFFILRYTKHRAMKFANFQVLKRATGQRFITRNYTILVLRSMIIVCAILAVSGAIFWYEGPTNENEYVIAIDTSASMTAQDFTPSRLAAAKLYAEEFIDGLDSHTRVGLVSFSGITFIETPLTSERANVKESLRRIDVEASGTDIPGAIVTSTNLLISTERGRALILITDGSNTIETFTSDSVQRAVNYAHLNRVKIFTIGVGSDTAVPIGYLPTYYNISATYDVDNLERIANATGGRYYAAFDTDELSAAYENIKSSDQTSTLDVDLTPGLMLTALILILLEWGLISTRFRMLP